MNSRAGCARHSSARARQAIYFVLSPLVSSLFVAGPVLASGQASASTGAVPSFGHVFVIVGENSHLGAVRFLPDNRAMRPAERPQYLLAARQRGMGELERVDAVELLRISSRRRLDAQRLQAGAQSSPLLCWPALLDL